MSKRAGVGERGVKERGKGRGERSGWGRWERGSITYLEEGVCTHTHIYKISFGVFISQ